MPSSDTIHFGAGLRHEAAAYLAELGAERVVVITDRRWSPLGEQLAAALGDRHAGTFTGVTVQVPEDVADAARALVERVDADWALAIGGGSAIGVAKVLALDVDGLQVAAIPTTYAGSERTDIWGRIQGGHKTTGCDPRVRPRLVVYDPELQASLPLVPSQQSLLNALAHSIEAIYAEEASPAAHEAALDSLAPLWEAIDLLAEDPADPAARALALRGAWKASEALSGASMALHHKLAHVLGGSFGTPHGPTHATLLPYTLAFNQSASPTLLRAFAERFGTADPAAALYDKLRQHKLSVQLSDLGLTADDAERAADLAVQRGYANPRPFTRDELATLLHGARLGRRPTADTARVSLPGVEGPHGAEPASAWPASVDRPRKVVLAVHGRGANADRFIAQLAERTAHLDDVRFIAPQAAGNTWYPRGFAAPIEDNQPGLDSAMAALDAAWDEATRRVAPHDVVLTGFSQGACLLLTWLSRRDHRPGAVVAMSGAALPGLPGLPGDYSQLHGVPTHMCISADDPWVPGELWTRTAAALQSAGAHTAQHRVPGTDHHIHAPDAAALVRFLEPAMSAPTDPNDIRRVSNPGDTLTYLTGYGNHLRTEAVQGAVPDRINGPRQPAHGLFPELINGTGFTLKRALNLRSWLYRLRPAVTDRPFTLMGADEAPRTFDSDFSGALHSPEPQRYTPATVPTAAHDWLDGVNTFGGAGDPAMGQGVAIHLFTATEDMERVFVNIDGDLLLAPESGHLRVRTELGWLDVGQGELVVIPRGIRFQVKVPDGVTRGFMVELYNGHFQLPDRGVVGSNGLADERHFKAPVADYEDKVEDTVVVVKQGGRFWKTISPHSPFDVVGWHGRYAPFKYDLRDFMSMGSVSFDHPDPSILTVLTHPLDDHGKNAVDVGVFIGRWEPTEGTFRPPFFHRNSAIEFNMVLSANPTQGGYPQGAFSFTPLLTPHGLGSHGHHVHTFEADDTPNRLAGESIWLQFESAYQLGVQPRWLSSPDRDTAFIDQFTDYTLGPLASGQGD